MTYHQGFLYLTNAYGTPVEIINEARTAALLQDAAANTTSVFSNIADDADCPGLLYAPCTMASDGSVTAWQAIDTDITAAPWYSSTEPASAEACGFYIEEWTGLGGGHHARSVTPSGTAQGGAYFGRQSSAHRVMALNVFLVGTSERGLNHLFRWLESTLLLLCCGGTGDKPSLWLREHCPDLSDLSAGLLRADGVALIGGINWESPPVADQGQYVRKASFTLGAESPCLYRAATSLATGSALGSVFDSHSVGHTFDPADCAEFVSTSVWTAAAVTPPPYGTASPIVTITSPPENGKYLPPLRIVGYLNPAGAALTNPCGMYPIGALILGRAFGSVPAGSEVVIDFGARSVLYRTSATDLEWSDGSVLVDFEQNRAPSSIGADATLPRWFGFSSCDAGVVVVEPNILATGSPTAAAWTVEIQSAVRVGCV